ncbi:MAG: FHA domain-containing protein [Planctomycetes bacterium]|nr:FHA domain-containing protein [Planctomycetota bacterium]
MVARRGPPAGAAPSGPRHLLLRIGAPPLELEPNRTLVVGRQPDCDLSIPSGKVSRRHAEIYWKRDRPWIVDCGSQNGTTVNGRRITSDHELKDNDEIVIGPYVVTYRFGSETASAAAQPAPDMNALTQPMMSDAMAGNLGQMNLFELLQTLEFNGKTGTLSVFGPDGNGEMVFRNGSPVYAATEDNEGAEAVMELVSWKVGQFNFGPQIAVNATNMTTTVTSLLLEAGRRLDEQASGPEDQE